MIVRERDNCTGLYTDVTNSATYSSFNTGIATTQPGGQASYVAPGSTTVRSSTFMTRYIRVDDYCYDTASNGDRPTTVQTPTSLSVLSITVLPTGNPPADYGCPPSADYGIMVDIKYRVLDQSGNPILSSTMVPHENGTFGDGTPFDNDIGPSRISTTSKFTASDGTFHDAPVGACSNFPISNPGQTETQNITIIWNGSSYPVRSQNLTVTAPGAGSFGHGSITNGSDISKSR